MTAHLRLAPLLLVLLGAPGVVRAQTPDSVPGARCDEVTHLRPASLQDPVATLRRLPDLDGFTGAARTWSTAASLGAVPLCAGHRWVRGWSGDGEANTVLPVTVRATLNSAFPVERNNGLQWAGRGLSGVARAGFRLGSGPWTLQLRPEVAWSENRDFDVAQRDFEGRDEWSYPWWRNIDWPQRHGDESLLWIGPGESRLGLDLGAVDVALSSEQQSWGPALRFPLLLGPSAPNFPYFAFSSDRPIRLGSFASLEFRLMWGILDESDHFDSDPDNDRRVLGGLVASLQPSILPGFTLGAASLVQSELDGFEAVDLLNFLQAPTEAASGNVEGNGLGALFARWAVPGSGFEAYVEWARDDYSTDLDRFLSEPDRARALTLGFQQVAPWGARLLRVAGEATRLTTDEPDIRRPGGLARAVFYTHAEITQGHTNRGQLLGAAVGPAGSGQYLAVDLLDAGRVWGLYLERIRWDDEAYVRQLSDRYGREGHDVELALGVHHARSVNRIRWTFELAGHARRNRHFHNLVGEDPSFAWETNLRLETSLSWLPGSD